MLEQAIDRRLAPNDYDDLILWGGFVTRDGAKQRALGLIVHAMLSIGLASAYRAVLPSLPRWPGPLRGLLFVQLENALVYPCVPIMNRIHPSVRSGELPSLWTWRYFWVEIARHAAFGLVLGATMQESRIQR